MNPRLVSWNVRGLNQGCGGASFSTGAIFLLVGLLVVSCICGIGGLWKRLRCVWGNTLWLALLEIFKTT